MDYESVKEALSILGIDREVSLKELKQMYRESVKKNKGEIEKLSKAYKTLVLFIESYPFSFSESEFERAYPEYKLKKRFLKDPLWGGIK